MGFKLCKWGHDLTSVGAYSNGRCRECKRIERKKHKESNPEKFLANARKQAEKRRREKGIMPVAPAISREEKNRRRCITKRAEYSLNPIKFIDQHKKYATENRDKINERERKKRLAIRELAPDYTPKIEGFCQHGHKKTDENTGQHGRCKECRSAYKRTPARKRASAESNALYYLSDTYLLKRLGLTSRQVPQDFIEIKRLTIQLQRSLTNGNQVRS